MQNMHPGHLLFFMLFWVRRFISADLAAMKRRTCCEQKHKIFPICKKHRKSR